MMPLGEDSECSQGEKTRTVIASLVCIITLIIIELRKTLWEESLIEHYYYYFAFMLCPLNVCFLNFTRIPLSLRTVAGSRNKSKCGKNNLYCHTALCSDPQLNLKDLPAFWINNGKENQMMIINF